MQHPGGPVVGGAPAGLRGKVPAAAGWPLSLPGPSTAPSHPLSLSPVSQASAFPSGSIPRRCRRPAALSLTGLPARRRQDARRRDIAQSAGSHLLSPRLALQAELEASSCRDSGSGLCRRQLKDGGHLTGRLRQPHRSTLAKSGPRMLGKQGGSDCLWGIPPLDGCMAAVCRVQPPGEASI